MISRRKTLSRKKSSKKKSITKKSKLSKTSRQPVDAKFWANLKQYAANHEDFLYSHESEECFYGTPFAKIYRNYFTKVYKKIMKLYDAEYDVDDDMRYTSEIIMMRLADGILLRGKYYTNKFIKASHNVALNMWKYDDIEPVIFVC